MGRQPRRPDFPRAMARWAACVACAAALAGCSWNDQRSEVVGSAIGGVVGGVLGSKVGEGTGRTVTTVLGATLGTMLGQDLARNLNDVDQIFHDRATEQSLEYGQPGDDVSWSNPDSGNSGSVTAGEAYENENGENCRTFESTVTVDGEKRTGEGVACRTADGNWKVVEEPA